MRARLALQASGLAVELRNIELKNKPAELLQASPKGTVPVLVLSNDRVIEQSLDIMVWALKQSAPQGWMPKDGAAMQDALACVEINDGPFKHALDRYKYPTRYALSDGLHHRDLAAHLLMHWENRLHSHPHLNGPHWGFLDAAIAPFVRQFAHTDPTWFAAQNWPQLKRWLAKLEESPEFAAVMQKLPLWQTGNAPCITRFAADSASAAAAPT